MGDGGTLCTRFARTRACWRAYSCALFRSPRPPAPLTLVAIAVYIALQLGIGAWVSRRIKTEDDYLLAGRSLGPILGTFSIFATWFGAETVVGSSGAIYTDGLAGGRADPFGYGLCLVLMGAFLARPLYRRRLTTLADLYRQRYGPGVERLAVVLTIPASILWAGAQVRAFGEVLAHATVLTPPQGIALAAVVVVLYTTWGGLLADAYTDLLQGVALLAGLVILFLIVLGPGGGMDALAAVPAERWNPLTGFSGLGAIEKWAIPICGSVVAVELVSRVIACRSEGVAVRSSFSAAGIYFVAGAIPALLGLIGPSLMPGLENPETLLPSLADAYLPPVLRLVFVGALVSAILSTVDSTLLVTGSLVSHNVAVPLLKARGREVTEAGKVRLARIGVVVFGVVAYVLARSADGVYALVEEASAFGSAGLFVVILLALFTKRWGGKWAATGGMLGGFLVYIAADKVLHTPYPYLTSLAAAVVGYAVGAWIDARGR